MPTDLFIPFQLLALIFVISATLLLIFLKKSNVSLPPLAENSLYDILSNLESGRILDIILVKCRALNPVFRIRAPQLHHFIIVTDSTLARQILDGDKTLGFPGADKDYMYHRFDPGMLGVPNMFTKRSQGEGWEWARKAVAPTFSHLNIQKKVPILRKTLSKLCDMLIQYETTTYLFDLHSLMLRFTFDFSTVAMFGMCFDALGDSKTDGNKFLHEVEIVTKEYFQKQFHNPLRKFFFWNKDVQRGLKAREYVELFQKRILDDYRASISADELKTDPSLIAQLLRR